jgi:hypothetical protein
MSSPAARSNLRQMIKMEQFIKAVGFTPVDLRKGQSMQFMNALWRLSRPQYRGQGYWRDVSLDEIIDFLIGVSDANHAGMWFNPHGALTGFDNSRTGTFCESMENYKFGGESVIDMSNEEKKRKAIKHVIQANVINTTNYQETSTRVSDNSVFVKHWCDLAHYRKTRKFKFSADLQGRLDGGYSRSRISAAAAVVTIGVVGSVVTENVCAIQ